MNQIKINGKTKIYGIIGNPVSHSFSPYMHSIGFQYINYNAVYLPFKVEKDELPKLLDSFKLLGVLGFNVTVPYKEDIIPYLDWVSPQARILGSVNTVVYKNKQWMGYSTDGNGFIRSVEAEKFSFTGKQVTLIGAGGSAKSIAIALCEKQISSLNIINRTEKKAKILSQLLSQLHPSLMIEVNNLQKQSCDILINSTSVGMDNHKSPASDELIKKSDFIVDIIYNPSQTPFLKKAIQYDIKNMNGLGMLLYQGVDAFEIWTDQIAPVEVMRKSLLESL